MNFRLILFSMVASATTLLYLFGDGLALGSNNAANLDAVFIPLLGRAGYYIFELVVPVIALASTYYAVVLAYREGLKDAAEL
jgi:hypothetical protein